MCLLLRLDDQGAGHPLLGVAVLGAIEGILTDFGGGEFQGQRFAMADILTDIDSGLGGMEREIMGDDEGPALQGKPHGDIDYDL